MVMCISRYYSEIRTGHFQALVPYLSKLLCELQVGFDVSCRFMFVILSASKFGVEFSLSFTFLLGPVHALLFLVLGHDLIRCVRTKPGYVYFLSSSSFFFCHTMPTKGIVREVQKKNERKNASCCCFSSLFIMRLSHLLHPLDSPGYSTKSTCVLTRTYN